MAQPTIWIAFRIHRRYKEPNADDLTLHVMARKARQTISQALPHYREFRTGDVRHSPADMSKVQRLFGYAPIHPQAEAIKVSMSWYIKTLLKTWLPASQRFME
jgi:hypothetical protein